MSSLLALSKICSEEIRVCFLIQVNFTIVFAFFASEIGFSSYHGARGAQLARQRSRVKSVQRI